jgi:hypothetical protein
MATATITSIATTIPSFFINPYLSNNIAEQDASSHGGRWRHILLLEGFARPVV